MRFIGQITNERGLNQDRLTTMGHSAGGHIVEMQMTINWLEYASDLPRNLVHAGVPVSPLSLLETVRLTVGINEIMPGLDRLNISRPP